MPMQPLGCDALHRMWPQAFFLDLLHYVPVNSHGVHHSIVQFDDAISLREIGFVVCNDYNRLSTRFQIW